MSSGELFRGKSPGGNCLGRIFIGSNCPGGSCPGGNYLGVIVLEGNFVGGGNCPGAVVLGGISQG